MLLDRRLNLLNIWRVCRELSAAFFWSHNSAASFHRMRCASCTRHGAALFPRKDRKRMAHRDVTAQFKLFRGKAWREIRTEKKTCFNDSSNNQTVSLFGGVEQSQQTERCTQGRSPVHQRADIWSSNSHLLTIQTHLLTRPACLWTVDGGRAQNRAQDLLALRQQGSPPHLPPCHSDNKY